MGHDKEIRIITKYVSVYMRSLLKKQHAVGGKWNNNDAPITRKKTKHGMKGAIDSGFIKVMSSMTFYLGLFYDNLHN